METCNDIFTFGQYLRGKVRNIEIPDNALMSICFDAGVEPDMACFDATEKERDLALAWLYVWIAGSPAQSGGYTEKDADWEKSENGERMSSSVLKQYLDMANDIFDKYDLPLVGDDGWGFVGRGICNPRLRGLR